MRQIVQVSIGGKKVRLKLTNEFSQEATEIRAVELAIAKTAGSSSEIDEKSTVSLTFDGKASVEIPAGGKVVSDPVNFKIGTRQNVAITIHYGASSASVSGKPSSIDGNATNAHRSYSAAISSQNPANSTLPFVSFSAKERHSSAYLPSARPSNLSFQPGKSADTFANAFMSSF